jgi:hypothetical protein
MYVRKSLPELKLVEVIEDGSQYCSVKDFFLSSREQGDRSREKKEN